MVNTISQRSKLDVTLNRCQDTVVRMVGIVKRFPGVLANDHVNFELRTGEIHALLGENGAGKTTLMNILYGIYHHDEGEIYIKGRRVNIRSPRDAMDLGIGMVHQHFMLVPSFTVAENVALGLKEVRLVLDLNDIKERIKELSEKFGLRVDPDARIWQLSVGEKQRVEIIKALYRNAEILILDEPTSVLTPQEVSQLFSAIKIMVSEGLSVIFITHKLDEVFQVADRVTVMRRGKVVGILLASQTAKEELARLMVGREVLFKLQKEPVERGRPVLEVESLWALDDRGLLAVRGVSFKVKAGEILGVAGVAGNGQRELAEVIVGLREAQRGRIIIEGEDMTNKPPSEVLKRGVAYIPEDRLKDGLIPDFSIAENLLLGKHRSPEFSKKLSRILSIYLINWKKIIEYAAELIKEFNINPPCPWVRSRNLSGGNIQRLILARELSAKPKLIVACQPTRGLDVAATEYVRSFLLKQRAGGCAVLLISEDLDEVLQLSDRVMVMHEGKVMGIVPAEGVDLEEVGLMMAGTKVK